MMCNDETRFEVVLYPDACTLGSRIYCKSLAAAMYHVHTFCDNHPSKHSSADICYVGSHENCDWISYVQGFGICDGLFVTDAMWDRLYN